MNDSIFRISLDIHEHGSQAVLKAKNTDTGRKLCVSLREGGTPYIIADDCYAAFKATKPDGTILFNDCTIEDNEIVYEFTEQTCAAIGRSRCEIALYGPDDKLITSPRFALLVDGTIYPDGRVESTDEFSALTKMVSDGLEVIEGATEATGKANEATEDAKVATQNAENAAGTANQAAAAATQAAQSANTATANANSATSRANESTQAANSATSNANLAAENANEAATNVVRIAKNAMTAGEVAGESVSLDDAVEFGFIGCRIFGKTTQNGTPTPDAPVDLVNIGNSGSITVNVTGENDAQIMTIATPNGLPGIPVTSGGNYTDANGRQWICDEKDFARGVYVQRVNKYEVSGKEEIQPGSYKWQKAGMFSVYMPNIKTLGAAELSIIGACLSTHGIPNEWEWMSHNGLNNVGCRGSLLYMSFENAAIGILDSDTEEEKIEKTRLYLANLSSSGNPVSVMYILATPIETPLSEEELAAYASLHTYRDSTTVSNDAGAYMELEYVVDTKKYIDSKLSSAIHAATVE